MRKIPAYGKEVCKLKNVLLVEQDSMARKLMEIFIRSHPAYCLLPPLEEAGAAVTYCAANPVDLILLDARTAIQTTGLEIIKSLKARFPETQIIIMTDLPEYSYLSRSRLLGANSFWYKEPDAEALTGIMARTLAGESVYPDSAPVGQLGAIMSDAFTQRELQILKAVASGKTDAEIAEQLHLSVYTVKQYIQKIRRKTGFSNRTELAVRAVESGIVANEYT